MEARTSWAVKQSISLYPYFYGIMLARWLLTYFFNSKQMHHTPHTCITQRSSFSVLVELILVQFGAMLSHVRRVDRSWRAASQSFSHGPGVRRHVTTAQPYQLHIHLLQIKIKSWLKSDRLQWHWSLEAESLWRSAIFLIKVLRLDGQSYLYTRVDSGDIFAAPYEVTLH